MARGEEQIRGRHVVLVPLRGIHAGELAGLLDEASLRAMLGVVDVEGLRRRFAGWESRRSPDGTEAWLNWVVRRRSDGAALGWVQVTVRSRNAEVAYALLPAEWGQGAASDAVRELVEWLLTELEVGRVTASIDPDNGASERVARAAGFAPTDRRDDGEVVWAIDARRRRSFRSPRAAR
jgi:RimJ/RimL family protein N-acetyltransferase